MYLTHNRHKTRNVFQMLWTQAKLSCWLFKHIRRPGKPQKNISFQAAAVCVIVIPTDVCRFLTIVGVCNLSVLEAPGANKKQTGALLFCTNLWIVQGLYFSTTCRPLRGRFYTSGVYTRNITICHLCQTEYGRVISHYKQIIVSVVLHQI